MGNGKDPLGILKPSQSPKVEGNDPLGILKKKASGLSQFGAKVPTQNLSGGGEVGTSEAQSGKYKPTRPPRRCSRWQEWCHPRTGLPPGWCPY